jgi:hypothetical protein
MPSRSVLTGVRVFRVRTAGLVGAALLALLAVALPPFGGPASATHPCGMAPDGSTYDPDPTADHDACGGPRPTPRPGDVQLGDADSGRTVTVTTGTRVYVDIHPPSGAIWNDVVGGSVLHLMYLDVQSGISTGVFEALAPTDGQQITASSDAACAHTETPCPRASQAWTATVIVQDPGSPPPSPSGDAQACAPRRAPTPNGFTLLTESSNGSTVRVPRGQPVLVDFTGCNGGGFDLPPTGVSDVLYRYRVNASNPGGATAVYGTPRLGTATLTSTTDTPCFHTQPRCLAPQQTWSATVEVVEPCQLSGPQVSVAGATVDLTGRVMPNAPVQVWFRQRGQQDFVARRQITAGADGSFVTSYAANDDYRWYATSGDCTTPAALTQVTPWLTGPAAVARGSVVPITVHGPASASVALYLRPPGGAFRLTRSGRLDATGTFRTSYVAGTDERYYAVTGPDRRQTARVLTQVH